MTNPGLGCQPRHPVLNGPVHPYALANRLCKIFGHLLSERPAQALSFRERLCARCRFLWRRPLEDTHA